MRARNYDEGGASSAKSLPFISSAPPAGRQQLRLLARQKQSWWNLVSALVVRASSLQVVGAKYNGEGPPIPRDCPPAIGKLMKSCWSNLPSSRPSFEQICETLEKTEGWMDEDAADPDPSPLCLEPQNRAIVSPLYEEQERGLEDDESVGSPGSGGSGGPTPPGKPCACRV